MPACILRNRDGQEAVLKAMKIEDIKAGDSLQGVEPSAPVRMVAVVPVSVDAIAVPLTDAPVARPEGCEIDIRRPH